MNSVGVGVRVIYKLLTIKFMSVYNGSHLSTTCESFSYMLNWDEFDSRLKGLDCTNFN